MHRARREKNRHIRSAHRPHAALRPGKASDRCPSPASTSMRPSNQRTVLLKRNGPSAGASRAKASARIPAHNGISDPRVPPVSDLLWGASKVLRWHRTTQAGTW